MTWNFHFRAEILPILPLKGTIRPVVTGLLAMQKLSVSIPKKLSLFFSKYFRWLLSGGALVLAHDRNGQCCVSYRPFGERHITHYKTRILRHRSSEIRSCFHGIIETCFSAISKRSFPSKFFVLHKTLQTKSPSFCLDFIETYCILTPRAFAKIFCPCV